MNFFIYIFIGAITGTLSGLLGVGGGIIVISALVLLFKHNPDIANQMIMHVAAGTSLAIMIFTASSSAYTYFKRNLINWSMVLHFLPGLCLGMIIGTIIASNLSSDNIVRLFTVFLFSIAIFLFFHQNKDLKSEIIQHKLNSSLSQKVLITIAAIGTGLISTIFGIGGGMLMVPFFLILKLNIRSASGTSAFCGLPIAIIGTILLTISGLNNDSHMQSPAGTIGFVYLPAVFVIASASMIFAPIGAYFASLLQPKTLKRILSITL